jgi:NAD(P)-dependent dehydrogenase (short-subunit alcohol dehydrogenase family)
MGILTGKVAIVTGAGKGLGNSIARAFAQEGACVTLVDVDKAACDRTQAVIETSGARCLAMPSDVAKREEVDRVVAATAAAFGTVDIVVNAAFANPSFNTPFESQTEADLMANINSSLLGTWNYMQACFPYLRRHGGKIINFSSAAFSEGLSGAAPYSAAKGAVVGLTNTVCQEWGAYGININLISPVAWTPAYDAYLKTAPPGTHEMYMAQNPMRRLGDPDKDIARVAVFLAGPDSNYITGRTISVDGGRALLRT